MSTLQERIKEYLRDRTPREAPEIAEAEYPEYPSKNKEADLRTAQEQLDKLKHYR